MAQWKRNPEECSGEYFFSGRGVMTQGVAHALAPEEIAGIIADLKRAVPQNDGLDYLQVYECDDGRRIWAIDQLSRSMLAGDDYTDEQKVEFNYFTLLLPDEY
ncbi:hypothetical protein JYT20_00115 [Rhodothermus sp. AH-315-K08]|nr:hypothetical protein [Rhodothermus sp. AH-315-K08]